MLEAFIPYSRANLELAYKPNAFFNHLEQIDRQKRYAKSTLVQAYYSAKNKGYLVNVDDTLRVSDEALQMLKPYRPARLAHARLIVMFDIPESHKRHRDSFRSLLRELKYVQIQKSIWSSKYDSRVAVLKAVIDLGIDDYVELYEAVPIK